MPENVTSGSFSLKKGFASFFEPSDPVMAAAGKAGVSELRLDALRPYKQHPFKPYGGQRFDDMVRSVRDNGVIMPVIVRPLDDGDYEILSGHNRAAAAKEAGYQTIPAIIRDGLTDDEALLIVTETNLIQRSFADMNHSERALTLAMHHDAIKRQGKRTDLIMEIENLLKSSTGAGFETSGTMCQKSDSRTRMSEQYDMSSRTIANYLRLNKLLRPHKDRLDSGEMPIRAAVALSYLPEGEQKVVDDILTSSPYKVDMKKADALRAASEKKPLTHETAEEILSGAKKPKPARPLAFKLKPKIVSQYFAPERKPQEIEDTIVKALDYYFASVKTAEDSEN
ncbi:MAG: ParB N-terminal domain-containing protein [Clostridiales bacterium]|jgi:ParB family chromosome partitioning protein|nr:ParB N-terminal domain-containing protein [Clostridiales bacterium]